MSSKFLKSGGGIPPIRGGYNNGTPGRVNVRYNSKRDTYRYRFQPIHPDQATTINAALAIAREEGGTEFDSVALYYICMDFLSGFGVDPSVHAKSETADCN